MNIRVKNKISHRGNKLPDLCSLARETATKIFTRRNGPSDDWLAGVEHLFHLPPLTSELVRAIRLISPHLNLKTDEKDRLVWENDQNGSCWCEFEALAPLLKALPKPTKVLEIGPGLGRSVVFFSRKLGWDSGNVHLYEGNGDTTKYTVMGPRFDDPFCGNIEMLRHVLNRNGVQDVTIVDSKQERLSDLHGPYDLVYSFYSVRFHWSIEFFLEDVLSLMNDGSIGIFTVPPGFTSFPRLDQLSYRIVDWKASPSGDWGLKFLVLNKKRRG